MVRDKPISWTWRIFIAVLLLLLVSMVFVLTPWGLTVMRGWLDKAYNECPPAERATHWSGDWFLRLAWWEGTLLDREQIAMEMYQEFLGTLPHEDKDKDGKVLKTTAFFDEFESTKRIRFEGKFDEKDKTGWGLLHPRACEAYFEYIKLCDNNMSKQRYSMERVRYATLFVVIYGQVTRTVDRPHPRFYVYWDEVFRHIDPYTKPLLPKVPAKPKDYAGPEALND